MKPSKLITKNKAFVLSLFDTGLGVVRSLGRAGVPVIGLDSNPVMPGFASRYCQAWLSPDPVNHPENLLQMLMEEGNRLDEPGILMPASDAYVLFIAQFRDELRKCFRFSLPPDHVLQALVDKRSQYALAEQAGIPIARAVFPETLAEVEQLKDTLDYPVFIKPYMGHLWREVFGSAHKGFVVQTPQELVERYHEITEAGLQALAQSIITGPDSNLYEVSIYISQSGEPQAIFTHRKIHQYPPRFGVGSCVESVHFPELVAMGMQLVRGFNYRGMSSTEFKRDDRDGQLKLIELNPRFGQQNSLASDCGVNFPLINYRDLTGQPVEPVTEFRTGMKWWDPAIDFPSFWEYFRAHETTPWQWLGSLRGTRSYPTFAWDDLRPFLKKYEYGKKLAGLPRLILRSS